MADVFGTGEFLYTHVPDWEKLPDGMTFKECPGVAVDSRDNVYVLTRGEHPVIVFDRVGNFLRSFGEGLFSKRTHGLYIDPKVHQELVDYLGQHQSSIWTAPVCEVARYLLSL